MTPGTRHWGRKWEWLIDQLSHLPERIAGFTLGHLPHVCATAVATAAAWVLARRFLWRWRHIRLADGARVIEIGVPPQVEPQASAALWTHLVGLLRPRWKRLICGQPHLGFEYCADATGVRIQIWVPAAIPPGIVERAVRATWPGASTTSRPATPPVPVSAAAEGGRLLPGRADHFPLACDHDTDPLRGILEAFTGLAPGEHAAVQILARPITGRRAARAHQAAAYLRGGRPAGWRTRLFDTLSPGRHTLAQMPAGELARTHPERAGQVRDILTKATQPRYEVAIRYTAATTKYSHPAAARPWLRTRAHTLAAVYALYTSGNQHLKRRRLRHPARVLAARRLDRGALLSVSELAALAHLPHDITATGITRAGARPTPPPPAIPTGTHSASTTRVLGDADAGHRRPVALPVADGRHHIHILGETGSGKSTLLAHLVLADAAAGRAALVIDPKGDLNSDILDRLPRNAVDRTVVFDPTEANPPSINVLAGPDPAFAVDQIIAVLRRCFASAWGPRIDDLLRASMLTLTHVNGQRACLVQLPALLTDPRYRARITGALTDDVLRGFWTSYEALTPGGRASLTAPVISKLRTFLLRPFIRNAIARADTSINLGDHLDAGGLILASATKGVLGDDAATLFGSLLLAHTWQHATRRTRTTQQQRRDAAIYVDETHNFLNLPGSISDVLAEARGYHLSLVLAHQHLTQLPPHLREAISANARNKIYFTASPEDAHQLRHHLAPALSEHDLAHLAAYQAAARLTIGGAQTRAFTLRTRPLPPPTPGRQDDVRQASRTHHTPPPQPAATPPPMRAGPPRRTGDPRITRP